MDVSALGVAGPAEIGLLRDRRPRRRHLAAALVDLAARGRLVIEDAGNDPELGEALDWLLLLRASDEGAASGRDALAPHEQRLLDLVAATPSHLLSRGRSSGAVSDVLEAVRADATARGWMRGRRLARRTEAGRAVLAEVEAARAGLVRERLTTAEAAALLPQAVALGLGDLWAARLGQRHPPAPSWFHPGADRTARGWFGVSAFITAAAAVPPPGGGAGSNPMSFPYSGVG